MMDVARIAAVVFAAGTAGAIIFQMAVASGAPWGSYTMGGKFPGRLPPAMRVAAVVQALILALIAAVVLSHAGLAFGALAEGTPWSIWVVVAFSAVSVVLNSFTQSRDERKIWAPVTLVMFVSSLLVAVLSH